MATASKVERTAAEIEREQRGPNSGPGRREHQFRDFKLTDKQRRAANAVLADQEYLLTEERMRFRGLYFRGAYPPNWSLEKCWDAFAPTITPAARTVPWTQSKQIGAER